MGVAETDLGAFDERVRTAIANKRLLQLKDHGRVRVAEPHDYGLQNGVRRLLVYQLSEPEGPGGRRAVGWRLLEASKIEDLTVMEQTFPGSRGDSHQHHFAWDAVYARVGR
jgi:hypothetical protein